MKRADLVACTVYAYGKHRQEHRHLESVILLDTDVWAYRTEDRRNGKHTMAPDPDKRPRRSDGYGLVRTDYGVPVLIRRTTVISKDHIPMDPTLTDRRWLEALVWTLKRGTWPDPTALPAGWRLDVVNPVHLHRTWDDQVAMLARWDRERAEKAERDQAERQVALANRERALGLIPGDMREKLFGGRMPGAQERLSFTWAGLERLLEAVRDDAVELHEAGYR